MKINTMSLMKTDNNDAQSYVVSYQDKLSKICLLLLTISLLFIISVKGWAQGDASSHVDRAVRAHGDGWQNGAVKSWVAVGTVTAYHYDDSNRQSQETFPTTLIHVSDTAGGGKGDKFQRLTFKAPEVPSTGSVSPPQNLFIHGNRPDEILSREGTDGRDQWHSNGPLSIKATGRTQRLIESQTERSLEALFNFRKHGKNVDDVTARITGQGPNATGGGNNGNANANENVHFGRSRAVPSFEAARNKHVIEVSDPPGGGGGSNPHDSSKGQPTRYYIDDTTSLVTRMEFDYDTAQNPFSNQPVALTEVLEFSDYRDVPLVNPDPLSPQAPPPGTTITVKFPFIIDRYVNGQKVESIVFSQVSLNRNLRPENFRR